MMSSVVADMPVARMRAAMDAFSRCSIARRNELLTTRRPLFVAEEMIVDRPTECDELSLGTPRHLTRQPDSSGRPLQVRPPGEGCDALGPGNVVHGSGHDEFAVLSLRQHRPRDADLGDRSHHLVV